MSQLIVTIHGNPGVASDFDDVLAALNANAKLSRIARPKEGASLATLISQIDREVTTQACDEVIVIAYSWGSYLALQWALTAQKKPTLLVLVNPTLSSHNPIPSFLRHLTNLPVLGKLLLNKLAKSKTPEFVSHSFAPAKPTPTQRERMTTQLLDPDMWKGAIEYKLVQQENPLPTSRHLTGVKTLVIRGAQDASVEWLPQRDLLNAILGGNAHYTLEEIAGAGHALPWTHASALADLIRNAIPAGNAAATPPTATGDKLDVNLRIGYQPGATINNNITCYLERHLARFPERAAIRWVNSADVSAFSGDHNVAMQHHEITFAQFGDGIRRVASGLKKLGIGKGDRVILFLPMSVGMYTAMCAIQRIGAISVFLDSWARRTHLGASAECVDPKAMISHKAAFDLVSQVPEFNSMKLRIIAGPGNDGTFDAQLEELFKAPPDLDIAAVESETTALITFTTGSSGKPKGANRTHRFLAAQHEALWEVIPYTPTDSDMPAFPIFSLNNLASGVTTVLPALDLAKPSEKDAASLVSQILHGSITCTTLSPSMLNNVSAYCIANNVQLNGLRRVVTGGAPISKDNVRDFKSIAPTAEVWILYGSTEVEPMAHIEAAEMLGLPENEDPEIVESGVNVGHISEDLRYKFIRATHDNIDFSDTGWDKLEVAKGAIGEFIVTGDHVCQDYYNNPEAFFKAKIKDDTGAVWHRTGDLAYIDDAGYLWVVGRIHNMINRAGEYYFPVSAEIILKRCAFVKRGAFFAIPDATLGERTAVAIEIVEGYDDLQNGMQEIIRLFAKNKIVVDSFFVVDAIPMDPRHHSKVEYAVLRDMIVSGDTRDYLK